MNARQFLEAMATLGETCKHPMGECLACDQMFVFGEVAKEMLMREDYVGDTDVVERYTEEALDRWEAYFDRKMKESS